MTLGHLYCVPAPQSCEHADHGLQPLTTQLVFWQACVLQSTLLGGAFGQKSFLCRSVPPPHLRLHSVSLYHTPALVSQVWLPPVPGAGVDCAGTCASPALAALQRVVCGGQGTSQEVTNSICILLLVWVVSGLVREVKQAKDDWRAYLADTFNAYDVASQLLSLATLLTGAADGGDPEPSAAFGSV